MPWVLGKLLDRDPGSRPWSRKGGFKMGTQSGDSSKTLDDLSYKLESQVQGCESNAIVIKTT